MARALCRRCLKVLNTCRRIYRTVEVAYIRSTAVLRPIRRISSGDGRDWCPLHCKLLLKEVIHPINAWYRASNGDTRTSVASAARSRVQCARVNHSDERCDVEINIHACRWRRQLVRSCRMFYLTAWWRCFVSHRLWQKLRLDLRGWWSKWIYVITFGIAKELLCFCPFCDCTFKFIWRASIRRTDAGG